MVLASRRPGLHLKEAWTSPQRPGLEIRGLDMTSKMPGHDLTKAWT